MNRMFKMLFTLLLGILLIVPTITANSLADNDNQKRLIELKDIYEKGGISEAEYKAAQKIFSAKEDKSDKKLKKNKKSFSLKKKSKKDTKFTFFKNKKDEEVSNKSIDIMRAISLISVFLIFIL